MTSHLIMCVRDMPVYILTHSLLQKYCFKKSCVDFELVDQKVTFSYQEQEKKEIFLKFRILNAQNYCYRARNFIFINILVSMNFCIIFAKKPHMALTFTFYNFL